MLALLSEHDTVLKRLSMTEWMLDRLMIDHGYGVHHAVPGRGWGGRGAALGLCLEFGWIGFVAVLKAE